jgi:hypothetical protein
MSITGWNAVSPDILAGVAELADALDWKPKVLHQD